MTGTDSAVSPTLLFYYDVRLKDAAQALGVEVAQPR
jgi:hypothetical protein